VGERGKRRRDREANGRRQREDREGVREERG